MGAKPLIKQDEQDSSSTSCFFVLHDPVDNAVFDARRTLLNALTTDEASCIPKYHLSFCKLVLNEHLRSTAQCRSYHAIL